MCRVIAVSNQKGGVGKTVSCVNLGIGLAQEGKKVLLIDADPQGSLTISLGYEEPDEMEYSLATLMMNIVNDEKLNIEKTILHHKEGVDLIPANIELSAILLTMVDNRTNYARDISLMVYDTYSASIKVFGTEIPMSVRASEVSVEGGSIYSYDI